MSKVKGPSDKVNDTLDFDYLGSKDEPAESRTVKSRQRLRDKINTEVQEFINKGGDITHVQPNVTADPPRKPGNNYGGRPI